MSHKMRMRFFQSFPIQLIISIILAFILGELVGLEFVRFFYALSTSFVSILLLLLPFMVFIFIFRAILNLQKGFGLLLILILGGITLSNAVALLTSYGVAQVFLPLLKVSECPGFADKFVSEVTPLWKLSLPPLFGTDKALLSGILLGIVFSFLNDASFLKTKMKNLSIIASDKITLFLQKIFIPMLPLYVFGFCLKLSFDDALVQLFTHYGRVFGVSMILMLAYLLLLYLLATGFSWKKTQEAIKVYMPAGLTGFSTMSSAATMPVTLECTQQATKDRNFADLVIPSTANIHMLGDDLTVTMTAMALLTLCGQGMPDLWTFLIYTGAFCLAKFSCVGIPGASVLVVLPVLQQFLGFSPEMISMITTIYILQDSFGSFGNVMGNGGFALLIHRVYHFLNRVKYSYST